MSKKNKNSEFIDVKGVLMDYIRNWYWFVISIVLCCLLGYVFAQTHPQKSRVNSSILVIQDTGTANMLNGLGGLLGADPFVQDEIFVITSHAVLKKVAKDLGVNKTHVVKTGFLTKNMYYPTFPVDVVVEESVLDTLSVGISFKVSVNRQGDKADIKVKAKKQTIAKISDATLPCKVETEYGVFTVEKTKYYPTDESVTTWISVLGYDAAAENLAQYIKAEIASRKSNVIEMRMEVSNPVYGCDVLNDVMAVYNERGIEERNQRALKTAEFIEERIELIGAALSDAESQIESYKEGNRLIDVKTEATLNTQLKTQYESRLVELQTYQEILQMTMTFLSNDANRYELLPAIQLGGEEGNKMIEMYNEAVLNRMNLLSTAKPNNRTILEIERNIDAMRGNIVVAVERAIKTNSIAIKETQQQADRAISKLGNVPTQEREYLALKRQQEVKQQLYLFLLQRSEETAMLIANAVPKGSIVDPAYVSSKPIGYGKAMILLLGAIIGFFIPIIVLYLRGLLRNKINGRSDIERHTELPILGEMCIDKSGEAVVVSPDSTSAASELFRMIRTNLQFVLGHQEEKVVMVTSSKSGEGKSFISINLAATLALLGRKVVLVGMDIRKPQLANYLGISSSPGVTQYLSNSNVAVSEIIQPYGPINGMSVVVAGPIAPNPGELMTSPRVTQLIDELRVMYDYVIIDSAPVGMVSDTFNLTKNVDATVFVVRDKFTHLQDIDFLNSIAEEGRLRRTNIIINGTSSQKGYGYGYR